MPKKKSRKFSMTKVPEYLLALRRDVVLKENPSGAMGSRVGEVAMVGTEEVSVVTPTRTATLINRLGRAVSVSGPRDLQPT